MPVPGGRQTITNTTLGGVASELNPIKLPSGPSPLCVECDFDQIGSVRTRDGLFSVYSYLDLFSGPNNAGNGASVSTGAGQIAWSSPNNIPIDSPGTYAALVTGLYGVSYSNYHAGPFTATSTTLSCAVDPTFSSWTAHNPYSVATIILDSNGNVQRCTTAGTSGATHPIWATNVGGLTLDGSGNLVWTCLGAFQISVGDTLIALVSLDPDPGPAPNAVSSFMDDQGNTWNPLTLVQNFFNAGGRHQTIQAWYAVSVSDVAYGTALNLTINFPLSAASVSLVSFSGLGAVTHSVQDSGSAAMSWSSGSLNISANEVLFSFSGANFTQSVSSPFTVIAGASGGDQTAIAYYNPGSAGTYSDTWTAGSSSNWTSSLVSFSATPPATENPFTSQLLKATNYSFSIPTTVGVTGIGVTLYGHQTTVSGSYLNVTMLSPGNPAPTITCNLPSVDGAVEVGGASETWNQVLNPALINGGTLGFSVQAVSPNATVGLNFYIYAVKLTIYLTPNPAQNFNWINTFEMTDGGVLTLAIDNGGVCWQEDVINNPYQLTSFFLNAGAGSFAYGVTEDDREFIAISNLREGTGQPIQYDGTSVNRLSQEGPAVSPVITSDSSEYAIVAITQPGTQVMGNGSPPDSGGYQIIWSAGPGIASNGSVISIYFPRPVSGNYASYLASLGFEVGTNVILAGIQTINGQNPNGTYVVTFVGSGAGFNNSGLFPVFSVQAAETTFANDIIQNGATYQFTLATVQTAVPVPNLTAGSQITIAGSGSATYDSTWTILAQLNGAQMNITQTAAAAQVATYNYNTVEGVPVGYQNAFVYAIGDQIVDKGGYLWQVTTAGTSASSGYPNFAGFESSGDTLADGPNTLIFTNEGLNTSLVVTVSGCVNGAIFGVSPFNVTQAVIIYADQSTFKVNIGSTATITASAETATAIVNGTEFTFNPLVAVGSSETGGNIVLAGGLTSGFRFATCFYITEAGLVTPASVPVKFGLNEDAAFLNANNLPIGPTNVVARGVAITESGTGAIAGANFYYLPTAIQEQDPNNPNALITYGPMIVPDNISTTAKFNLTDANLLNATGISIQGNNLFQTIELGSSMGVFAYSNRLFAWGVNDKINNLIEGTMSFNGGVIALPLGAGNYPLGWTVDGTYGDGGQAINSPLFGFSYEISNSTGSTQALYGMLTQPAYQDYLGVPIINIQTPYNLRIVCRNTTADISGGLTVDLISASTGVSYGAATISVTSMSSDMQLFDVPLLVNQFAVGVPMDLTLRIYASAQVTASVIQVDRMEIYNANEPKLGGGTDLLGSYVDAFEQFDQLSGNLGTATQNQQPVISVQTLFDQLILFKTRSMYSTEDNGLTEPYKWDVKEISNKVGCVGINAVAVGEGWLATVDQSGLYIWEGGQPKKISGEIQPTWDMINWKYGHTIWATNDPVKKRITIGVPIATPNRWMPNFTANSNPTSPNVLFIMSYRELNTAAEMAQEGAVRQTFMGTLKAFQLGRKWSFWDIPTSGGAYCVRPDATEQLLLGNGVANSKIYQQAPPYTQFNDDGEPIYSQYMTYGAPNSDEQEAKNLGQERMLNDETHIAVTGAGFLAMSTYPDYPNSANSWVSTPQPVHNPAPYGDVEIPVNSAGYRFFTLFSNQNVFNQWFEIARIVWYLQKHPHAPKRGFNP